MKYYYRIINTLAIFPLTLYVAFRIIFVGLSDIWIKKVEDTQFIFRDL
jgi:hypothetical protein